MIATGIGSWPGNDVAALRTALAVIRDVLAVPDDGSGVTGLPYLPELPARGPGAAMIGRTAHLLVDLPVDLQPQGWRLVDRPGRDAERAAAWWRQDLDELAEAFDGWSGPLKVQVTGPWTLAASLWLPLGDRVLSDAGAVRDLVASLAEGTAAHLDRLRALLPGVAQVLQVDEPALPAVLAGRVRSDSGYRVLPAPDRGEAVAALAAVLDRAEGLRGIHCCGDDPPVDVLLEAGAGFVAVDAFGAFDAAGSGGGPGPDRLPTRRWEQLAAGVERGLSPWPGAAWPETSDVLDRLARRWHELGLDPATVPLGFAPPCGLAGLSPEQARAATRAAMDTARRWADRVRG